MDEAIRNGIFAGESGGDYDALFGFSNREGGRFAHVRPSTMTIDDVIAFQSPKGEYAGWVRPQVGRTATPVGAYQVVGDTLKAAKAGLGLTGKELYDKATQDAIGDWVLKTQGTGAWSGYKGPKAQASGLRHVGGAGSGPKYFAPKPGGAGGGGQYTLTDPGPGSDKTKKKTRGEVAGEGLKAMADAWGGAIQDPAGINTPVNQDMGGGAPMASFFRPQLMPTSVQAGSGGMGSAGQPDMRQLLAMLMQGG